LEKWREESEFSKWLNMNEDLAYKKVLNCTDVTKLKTIGKYLSEMRCKWENKACTTQLVLEASGKRNGNSPQKNYWKKE